MDKLRILNLFSFLFLFLGWYRVGSADLVLCMCLSCCFAAVSALPGKLCEWCTMNDSDVAVRVMDRFFAVRNALQGKHGSDMRNVLFV